MKVVKFQREHEITVNGTDTRVYPKGWQGEVDDATAAAAVKATAAVEIVPQADSIDDAAPAKQPKTPKVGTRKGGDKAAV